MTRVIFSALKREMIESLSFALGQVIFMAGALGLLWFVLFVVG